MGKIACLTALMATLVSPSASAEDTGLGETTTADTSEHRSQSKGKKTTEGILRDFRARAGYGFRTRTSNRKGSETEKSTDRHSALAGFDYQANRYLTFGLDGSLNGVNRRHNQGNLDYRSFSVEPNFRLFTDQLTIALSTAYTSKDSMFFEVEGRERPSLGADLGTFLRLGQELQLRTRLSGRKLVRESPTQSLIYGGLGLRATDSFSLDAGVAHETNNFYNQTIDYGVLGAESRGKTSARAELLVGKRFGVGLAVRTSINDYLDLGFNGYASRDSGNVRSVDEASLTVSLIGKR